MSSSVAPVPSLESIQKKCWNPVCVDSATSRCARCRQAIYCGVECQGAHWPAHKSVCIATPEYNSSVALTQARKLAGQAKMNEAADCVPSMNKGDQDIFLQEMAGNSQWKTVDVAIKLARSERVKEAVQIMMGFPTEDKVRFFDEVPSLMDEFLSQYGGRVIRI